MSKRVVYIVACAAPPARSVPVLVAEAKRRGWDTCLITTPAAYKWLDIPALMECTGIRSELSTECLANLTYCPPQTQL